MGLIGQWDQAETAQKSDLTNPAAFEKYFQRTVLLLHLMLARFYRLQSQGVVRDFLS